MKKCVTVVIPSYNRAHLLELTIPSYIQPNVLEIIVVDDCSTDNTYEVIKKLQNKYPLIKYEKTPVNSKQTVAKNIGKRKANGEYVYFGDDDSLITSDSIKNY